jgi:hypothetical protein
MSIPDGCAIHSQLPSAHCPERRSAHSSSRPTAALPAGLGFHVHEYFPRLAREGPFRYSALRVRSKHDLSAVSQ